MIKEFEWNNITSCFEGDFALNDQVSFGVSVKSPSEGEIGSLFRSGFTLYAILARIDDITNFATDSVYADYVEYWVAADAPCLSRDELADCLGLEHIHFRIEDDTLLSFVADEAFYGHAVNVDVTADFNVSRVAIEDA